MTTMTDAEIAGMTDDKLNRAIDDLRQSKTAYRTAWATDANAALELLREIYVARWGKPFYARLAFVQRPNHTEWYVDMPDTELFPMRQSAARAICEAYVLWRQGNE